MEEEERPAVHTMMLLDMVVEEKKDEEVTQVGWGKVSSFVFLFSVHTVYFSDMLNRITVNHLFTCHSVPDFCVHAPSFCECI